jgi:cellobiose-specific phosphotransferase system component IIA
MEKKEILEKIVLGVICLFGAAGIYINGVSDQQYRREIETIDSTYYAGLDSLNKMHKCQVDSLNKKYRERGMLGLSQ